MTELFLSYRTDDSVHAATAISGQLARHFGRAKVFRDHDSLALGMVYPRLIRRAVQRCDKVLAVIGPHWLDARNARGGRRIDDPRDWVRVELRTAFGLGTPVIPVLLDQTPLPEQDRLPEDIRLLSLSNYWNVRHQSLEADVRGLIEKLDPGAPADARHAPPSSSYSQDNQVHGNGDLYANQGNQYIESSRPHGNRR